ncbi:hypothetical protein D3C73_707180 [compost metagenome]
MQPQAFARYALCLQLLAQRGDHLRVIERFRRDLHQHLRRMTLARTRAQYRDRLRDDPAVDVRQQAVFFGDAEERGRAQQLSVVFQPQVRFIQLQRLALQVQHRLVMQLEAIACQGLADTRDPALHAFFFHAIDSGRVEDAAGIAERGSGLRTFTGARQHLADAGDLLAHLHPANADGHRGRARADAEDVCGVGFADALGQCHGLCIGAGLQHGETVFAETGQLRILANDLGQQGGEGADQGVGRGQSNVRDQARVMIRFDHQQAELTLAAPRLCNRVLDLQHEGRAVEQAGDLVALTQVFNLASQLRVELHAPAEYHLQAGFALVGG